MVQMVPRSSSVSPEILGETTVNHNRLEVRFVESSSFTLFHSPPATLYHTTTKRNIAQLL
jgi:hypothetical protein